MLDHDLQETAMADSARAALDRLLQSIPQVVADLRELRATVRARTDRPPGEPVWRGADPLIKTATDLAYQVAHVGGWNMRAALENSGEDPSPQRLAADWAAFEASLAQREPSGAPIVVQHAGRRY